MESRWQERKLKGWAGFAFIIVTINHTHTYTYMHIHIIHIYLVYILHLVSCISFCITLSIYFSIIHLAIFFLRRDIHNEACWLFYWYLAACIFAGHTSGLFNITRITINVADRTRMYPVTTIHWWLDQLYF